MLTFSGVHSLLQIYQKPKKIHCLADRFTFNKYWRADSPSQLRELAELRTLEDKNKYERLKYLYLIVHHHIHIWYADVYDVLCGETSRHRYSMFIRSPIVHTACFKHSFFPNAITEWNTLSQEPSNDSFMKHLREILICNTPFPASMWSAAFKFI